MYLRKTSFSKTSCFLLNVYRISRTAWSFLPLVCLAVLFYVFPCGIVSLVVYTTIISNYRFVCNPLKQRFLP